MKKVSLKICFLFFLLIILIGCQNKTDYTIVFDDKMIIDLNSKLTPLNLIKKIDDHNIIDKDIEKNEIIYKNLSISCSDQIDSSKIGFYKVIYKTNDLKNPEIKKTIQVKDISKPKINIKEGKIEKFVNELNDINYYNYFNLSDNDSQNPLKIEINSAALENKPGEYKVSITVKDFNNNESIEYLKVLVKEKPIENNENNATNNSNTSNEQVNKSNDKKSNKSVKSTQKTNNINISNQVNKKSKVQSNPSQYNRFFSGYSIDSYNQANLYAEAIYKKGLVKGFEINPTVEGVNVTFY